MNIAINLALLVMDHLILIVNHVHFCIKELYYGSLKKVDHVEIILWVIFVTEKDNWILGQNVVRAIVVV